MSNPAKILIVDDDNQICTFLSQMLIRRDYATQVSQNGRDAIRIVRNQPFDIVMLDMGLPDMTGEEVMQTLGRHRPETLVVMMTGNATVESAVKAVHNGAYSYLRKPFESEELFKTIENALNHKQLENDRKRAEKALLESEERFRNLVENSLMGISIVQNHRFIYQNPAQQKLLGQLPESYDIKDFRFVYPDEIHKVTRFYQNILTGNTLSLETEFRLYPPGKMPNHSNLRWVRCQASAFNYHGQKAILFNMIDITRSKELEHLIGIKSKMASLGRIAAGMAHEIRNPLTGINSYLYTLEDLCRADDFELDHLEMIQQIAGQIQVASNKIESVIKRVLDFSRPNAPKMELIDISHPLQEAIELSEASLRKSGIKFEQALALKIPRCYGDAHMIEQVILNLINNAAKALEKTKAPKTIAIASTSENGMIVIRISDSGPGVPADQREKIFDPFFTTHAEGSGIGLSIAQRIITDHNGAISVGSSVWGGAEFSIKLPIEKRLLPR